MKNITLLVWLTQLGLSVAVPPAMFIFLAVWVRDTLQWGDWVLWAGIILGVVGAVQGLITSLQAMSRLSREKPKAPPVGFNDHE